MKSKKYVLMAMVLVVLLMMSGCQKDADNRAKESTQESSKENSTVSIQVMDKEVTFDKVPEKAVVVGYDNAEVMAALGLENRIAGLTGCMYRSDHCYPDLEKKLAGISVLPDGKAKGVPSFESVLKSEADMIYCMSYHFTPDFVASIDDFEKNNIKYYASKGTYGEHLTMEAVYEDIQNIGKIFHVEEKANQLIQEYKSKILDVTDKIKNLDPVSVFVFDYQDKTGIMTPGGKGFQNNLLKLAGADNVFADFDADFDVATIEQIITRDPEYIVLIEYWDKNETEEKIAYLESLPELANVKAVKNKNYISLTGIEYFPSLHNADGIRKIAEVIHPDAFK